MRYARAERPTNLYTSGGRLCPGTRDASLAESKSRDASFHRRGSLRRFDHGMGETLLIQSIGSAKNAAEKGLSNTRGDWEVDLTRVLLSSRGPACRAPWKIAPSASRGIAPSSDA